VKLVLRRLGRLESRYPIGLSPKLMPGLRLIVTRIQDRIYDEPGNPPASTCDRCVLDGSLTEIVRLNGEDSSLSGDELDRFIDGFPIEMAGAS
jgi:hypothetical protein